jgi:hypothetical protein
MATTSVPTNGFIHPSYGQGNSAKGQSKKLLFTSKKNVVNQPATYSDNWYGTGRPLQIYRKTLDDHCVQYGPELKNLKNGCNTCIGPMGPNETRIQGNVMSFSGGSGIRSATSNLSPQYYSDTANYLRSRGQSYTANADIHKVPGIQYANKNGVIWPQTSQSGPGSSVYNSSLYKSNTPNPRCPDNLCVYKPNNIKFASQGAVSSSTLMLQKNLDARNRKHLSAYDKKKLKLVKPPCCGTV